MIFAKWAGATILFTDAAMKIPPRRNRATSSNMLLSSNAPFRSLNRVALLFPSDHTVNKYPDILITGFLQILGKLMTVGAFSAGTIGDQELLRRIGGKKIIDPIIELMHRK